jgi:antitoxin HicB
MDIRYPATVQQQADGRWFAQFVDLEDAFTEGQSKEEALSNAAEVLSAMLAWRLDAGQPVPAPSPNLADAYYVAPNPRP